MSEQQIVISNDKTVQITAVVTNQGKTSSAETTISLFDGENLIETKPVNALNSGESEEIRFIWPVLGKAGENTIKAFVDSENLIEEFNEENNTADINVTVPPIHLRTETDRESYKIRQKVLIDSSVTNLTAGTQYEGLALITWVRDTSGNEVYRNSIEISSLSLFQSNSYSEQWNTAGLSLDGEYTITQAVVKGPQILASSTARVILLTAPDFSIRSDDDYRKIKQGETATYALYLQPFNG